MRLKTILSLLCSLFLLAASAIASSSEINWQQGTLQAIDEHRDGRVVYWENKGTIPIYDGYAFYDLTIRSGNTDYAVRYESLGDYFPAGWQVGGPIEFRIDGGRMYLLEYDHSEALVRVHRQTKARADSR
jgi:major membrane immunogen (membrane-anchored lipoprotein)